MKSEPQTNFLPMNSVNIKVLLITPDPAQADVIRRVLSQGKDNRFDLLWVSTLSASLEQLNKGGIAAVLVALSLAGRDGIESFDRLFVATPHIPTLVLGGLDDEDLARLAVQRGADDYLLTGYINEHTLPRALRNALAHKSVEEALFLEQDRAQVTLNSIGDAVLSTDLAGNITYLNLVAEKMTGWSREEACGRPLTEVFQIVDGATRVIARNPLALAIKENKVVGLAADCVLIRRDGVECSIEDSAAPIHDRAGQVAGAVIVFHDVSESLEMKIRMSHLALHDALTDLPNRNLLNDRVNQAIALARRHNKQFAVLFVDVDRFKLVNDTFGHTTGDQLLRFVADRLLSCVRGTDTVSRLGGDEFVVLLSEIEQARDAVVIADKMRASLAASSNIMPQITDVSISIGISVYPYDGLDADTLFKNADIALYHAKESGRNNSQCFTQDMNHRAVDQRSLETGLRCALERREFALNYQPRVSVATGVIIGAEALLRWHHPVRGTILPGLFIPIAEESRLIVPIGRWVLREACRQAQAWRGRGLPINQIAVNISAVEFQAKGFLDNVMATLKDTGLDPHCLELELTESVLMEDAESSASLLNKLKAMGVQLAIDDFGTGYSSLSYLSQFPIDTLKIDQSFVRKMTSDSGGATIVSTVINMGKSLKQRVVAEGVETAEQLAFLQLQNCEEAQGYHFSKPVSADAFATMLGAGAPGSVTSIARAKARSGGNGALAMG
ncbi:MAG: EAL domain-containing protein [Burkholderiales bacterium]